MIEYEFKVQDKRQHVVILSLQMRSMRDEDVKHDEVIYCNRVHRVKSHQFHDLQSYVKF